ncbi:putative mRNA-binding protein PUF3 (putative) [Pseudozyma hubeiensis]|nr:putative mRNA-binding protein PUF3 (putative) [Pseudozyma hubeiensis]
MTSLTPSMELSHQVQLGRYSDRGMDGAGYRFEYTDPRNLERTSLRQSIGGASQATWLQDLKPAAPTQLSMPAHEAYATAPVHQRFPSMSSSVFSEDRTVPPFDHDSDLSSDYSDLFQISALPFQNTRPHHASEHKALGGVYPEPQQIPLPGFVVEELKQLKLENMALKRMAQELVMSNNGCISAGSQGTDQASAQCIHHPPTSTPPRLQRVLNGADPVSAYAEVNRPSNVAPMPVMKAREVGASASMWAPERRLSEPLAHEKGNTPPCAGSKPFRASDISAAELSRRVAMDSNSPVPFSGYRHMTRTDGPLDVGVPNAAGSSALTASPTSSSPGPAHLVNSSKHENAPASALVTMILDRRGQEASVLLQQQLKTASAERRAEIIDAICARIVPLSHDRHGNFLVQSAIETEPDIARHLQGAFVELTMSQFGCHVVQKALEGGVNIREAVTKELLGSRLDQTLASRHSIHVWQRILETEWSCASFREQIFAAINTQLKGQWAQMARQETGSIICQNIFESAQPAEKAQCMHEVLEQLDECAMNQWGVWVVQHIIEHGSEDERRAALQGLVRSASKLTLSQYGQKAVMSGLKTGDRQFLQDYVEAMCHSSQPRRPPLIDVCLAPHGIQMVTQLLTTVDQKTRDRIISTVRRNSVFLKGSKAGMKVHQLCERARAFAGY